MVNGAVVRSLVAGDGRVSAGRQGKSLYSTGIFVLVCAQVIQEETFTFHNNVFWENQSCNKNGSIHLRNVWNSQAQV